METVSASFASKRTKILQDSERQLMKLGDFTHPMKKDVKKKSFSPPLGKMREW